MTAALAQWLRWQPECWLWIIGTVSVGFLVLAGWYGHVGGNYAVATQAQIDASNYWMAHAVLTLLAVPVVIVAYRRFFPWLDRTCPA